MRRVILSLCVAAGGLAGCKTTDSGSSAQGAASQSGHPTQQVAAANFVTVQNGQLAVQGQQYVFTSTNSYRMLESPQATDQTFAAMRAVGLNVLRIWAFSYGDGNVNPNDYLFYNKQPGTWPAPTSFPETRWQQLDYTIKSAADNHIRLILPLTNYWDNGIDVLCRWTGQAPDLSNYNNREFFYTNDRAKTLYSAYVQHMANRVNHLTGVAYKNDPTILMWEPMNEPRGRLDPSGKTVSTWLNWAGGVIKSFDPNHLVGSGTEGMLADFTPQAPFPGFDYTQHPFHANQYHQVSRINPQTHQTESTTLVPDGAYFPDDCQQPNIDLCSIHAWPYNWYITDDATSPVFTGAYIRAHREVVTNLGINKPIYVAEFGRQVARGSSEGLTQRDKIYAQAYQEAARSQMDGMGFWNIGISPVSWLQGYLSFDVLCDHTNGWDSTCAIVQGYPTQIGGLKAQ